MLFVLLKKIIVIIGIFLLWTSSVLAEDTSSKPILTIFADMHTAMINQVSTIPDEDIIVTVSDDKTAIVWSINDNDYEKILRVPQGKNDEGALYAVTASKKYIVVGGRTSGTVYVFGRKSGKMLGTITDLHGSIMALAFSQDEEKLAVGLSGKSGLKVYDMNTLKPFIIENDYNGSITAIIFNKNGGLITSSEDGLIRFYNTNFEKHTEWKADKNTIIWSLSASPDEKTLLVGVRGANPFLLSLDGLLKLREFKPENICSGDLHAVTFSDDGLKAYGAGTCRKDNERRIIEWDTETGKVQNFLIAGNDTVTALTRTHKGQIVYVGAEPSLGVYDKNNTKVFAKNRASYDFRDIGEKFKVSYDGSKIAINNNQIFDVFSYGFSKSDNIDFRTPIDKSSKITIKNYINHSVPEINNSKIILETNEIARSATTNNDEIAVIGTDFYLRAFNHKSERLWQTVIPSAAWGVNISGDGRYVLALLADGTLRWYLKENGREILALFIEKNSNNWVLWTPEGFFDHGLNGENMVGYQLNRGKTEAGEFIAVSQLYNMFYRRDLVMERLREGSKVDLKIHNELSSIGDISKILAKGLPPKIKIVGYCYGENDNKKCFSANDLPLARGSSLPKSSIEIPDNNIIVKVEIEEQGEKGEVLIRRNGALVSSENISTEHKGKNKRVEELKLSLDETKENQIFISAYIPTQKIETGKDEQVNFSVLTLGNKKTDKSILYVIAVGVSNYARSEFNLDNAAYDAKGIAKSMKNGEGTVYEKAEVFLLTDEKATMPEIEKAFKEVSQKAQPQDMVLVFLAGHGVYTEGKYYFATHELGKNSSDKLDKIAYLSQSKQEELLNEIFKNEGMPQEKLVAKLKGISASRMVVLLDTCYSGGFANLDATMRAEKSDTWVNTLGRMAGRFILAGSTSEQQALDASSDTDAKHGLFTRWVLSGIEGEADLDGDKKVNIYELATYAKKQVVKESIEMNYRQEPSFFFSGTDFFNLRSSNK